MNYPLSAYVREKALGYQPTSKPRRDRVLNPFIRELHRIATNFKQLHHVTGVETYGQWAHYLATTFPRRVLNTSDIEAVVEEATPNINDAGKEINRLAHLANAGQPPAPEDARDATRSLHAALKPIIKAVDAAEQRDAYHRKPHLDA